MKTEMRCGKEQGPVRLPVGMAAVYVVRVNDLLWILKKTRLQNGGVDWGQGFDIRRIAAHRAHEHVL
jgi:hypothetical protein